MSLEIVKALLLIAKTCAACGDCQACILKSFCGKIPLQW